MKIIYQADDGTEFDERILCEEYEKSNALYVLVDTNIGRTYVDDFGTEVICEQDVVNFICGNWKSIKKCLKDSGQFDDM